MCFIFCILSIFNKFNFKMVIIICMLVKFCVVINENVFFILIGGGGFINNLIIKRDIVNKISGYYWYDI